MLHAAEEADTLESRVLTLTFDEFLNDDADCVPH